MVIAKTGALSTGIPKLQFWLEIQISHASVKIRDPVCPTKTQHSQRRPERKKSEPSTHRLLRTKPSMIPPLASDHRWTCPVGAQPALSVFSEGLD